ncbi:MAG: hypothetical protein ACOCX3_00480 [Chloroflexota bacterium]
MKIYWPMIFVLLLLGLAPGEVLARGGSCPAIVEAALDAVDTFCTGVGRNQVCYGNVAVEADPQPDAQAFQFEHVGDVEDVGQLLSLRLQPMDEQAGTWGVALMKLQANLPDTSPGQNVTFLMFGDVSITSAVAPGDGQRPMQAFYLQTGIGDAACEEAPESGLLVQTPDGVEEVNFTINGVEVAVGSTVLFQSAPDNQMIVSTVEGSATLRYEGRLFPVIAGTRLRWALDADLVPHGLPQPPEAYEAERLRQLPLRVLARRITVAQSLSETQLDALHLRLIRGDAPCGAPGLPDCDRIFNRLEGDYTLWCVPPRLVERLSDDVRPLCTGREQPPAENVRPLATRRADNDSGIRPLAATATARADDSSSSALPAPADSSTRPAAIQPAYPTRTPTPLPATPRGSAIDGVNGPTATLTAPPSNDGR